MYKLIWIYNWSEFVKLYPHRFQNFYGPLDKDKADELNKLIRCGRFQNGFQRHTCPECGTVLIVPFTCKSRLCLSCARKKLFGRALFDILFVGWSLNLSHIMNTSLKHVHVTFTILGTILQLLFKKKYDPTEMIPLASSIFRNTLISSAKLKGKEYQPGILATLHKSGNGLN